MTQGKLLTLSVALLTLMADAFPATKGQKRKTEKQFRRLPIPLSLQMGRAAWHSQGGWWGNQDKRPALWGQQEDSHDRKETHTLLWKQTDSGSILLPRVEGE